MCVTFLHYISDEKIKTTRDQVTTQSNIPVSIFCITVRIVNIPVLKVIAVELEVSLYDRAWENGPI